MAINTNNSPKKSRKSRNIFLGPNALEIAKIKCFFTHFMIYNLLIFTELSGTNLTYSSQTLLVRGQRHGMFTTNGSGCEKSNPLTARGLLKILRDSLFDSKRTCW